jgi:addiction module HigA family antidote
MPQKSGESLHTIKETYLDTIIPLFNIDAQHKKDANGRVMTARQAKTPKNNNPAKGVGQILKTLFMDPLGLTAYRLSKDIGITPIAISHILRGKRAVTPAIALRLSAYFGVDADFWLSLQAHEDLQAVAKEKGRFQTKRCAALDGQAFLLKESKSDGSRNWQVLMVKTRSNGGAKRV